MDTQSQARLLVKILIGIAWLDGKIQPEERQYLVKIAKTHHLDEDIEIHPLLDGTMIVTQTDCEQWIQTYLGDRSIHDDDRLIEDISGLIYSDGDVATAEAKLLIDIQSEPTSAQPNKQILVNKIQQLYQSWVAKINS
jgi:uncharacterized tellurite resistance protein B-like protein